MADDSATPSGVVSGEKNAVVEQATTTEVVVSLVVVQTKVKVAEDLITRVIESVLEDTNDQSRELVIRSPEVDEKEKEEGSDLDHHEGKEVSKVIPTKPQGTTPLRTKRTKNSTFFSRIF